MIIEPGESFQPNPFGFNAKADQELDLDGAYGGGGATYERHRHIQAQ